MSSKQKTEKTANKKQRKEEEDSVVVRTVVFDSPDDAEYKDSYVFKLLDMSSFDDESSCLYKEIACSQYWLEPELMNHLNEEGKDLVKQITNDIDEKNYKTIFDASVYVSPSGWRKLHRPNFTSSIVLPAMTNRRATGITESTTEAPVPMRISTSHIIMIVDGKNPLEKFALTQNNSLYRMLLKEEDKNLESVSLKNKRKV